MRGARGWRREMKEAFGISLLVMGGVGCLLPMVPGIPLMLAGAAVLGHEHRFVRPWLGKLRRPQ